MVHHPIVGELQRASAVATKRSKSTRFPAPSRRTQIVLATFFAAMTVATGLLAVQDSAQPQGFLLTSVDVVGAPRERASDSVFHTAVPLDRQRWKGIVIHHSGEPAGDGESVHRRHLAAGFQGLGYHFLIGNGNGLGDGVVHVGYRWNEQKAGAHVIGRNEHAAFHNQHSIAICLIGNGDQRPFTDRQMAQLATLVQSLQAELRIPARNVHLHEQLAQGTTSPGRFFNEALFREQLRK